MCRPAACPKDTARGKALADMFVREFGNPALLPQRTPLFEARDDRPTRSYWLRATPGGSRITRTSRVQALRVPGAIGSRAPFTRNPVSVDLSEIR